MDVRGLSARGKGVKWDWAVIAYNKTERFFCFERAVSDARTPRACGPPPHLDHRQHALIGDGVGADGEVSRGVSADDAVHGVPVGTVGLIPVHHRQVGHHHVHLVLRHLPRKLANRKQEEEEGEKPLRCNTLLMHFNRLIYGGLLAPSLISEHFPYLSFWKQTILGSLD